ncbi:zinc-binding dehydrogenase [Oerskovia jenensis]|uniref:NADPH:quinone reductase-like Zn-dependent oxidoreductase n=1 Tax=Oerskovia jenensis TaxID=162169 RepID=A0ABS2LH67_9CELL|nr:zinc-binding dehydrogenase [Oerskovia jenensis]MBM7479464.1 NADPH:quinone reductase-like Zn-dependent oxidoreductase [Oerskovia jenensis]
MLAAYVTHFDQQDPLAGLTVGDLPAPEPRENWSVVDVRAASLNHHDLWSLRGVGLRAEQLPMILGTDAAGIAPDGTEVVAHGVIGADGHGVGPSESRTLLSEKYAGTLAEQVAVPTKNLVPKPPELTFVEAACLPTAWLTAYRMLFSVAGLAPGDRVLVQGAGGGVASAATRLASAAGIEVFVTSRSSAKRARALQNGASAVFEPGARPPARVDAVIETVGQATWSHSMRSVRPGGTVVVAGATSGDASPAELSRIFFQEITVRGVTMGSREDLAALLRFLARTDVRPTIDEVFPLAQAASGLARLDAGEHYGKIVLTT